MSPDAASARPSQVTVAGWTVVGASVVVVLTAFQAMGHLDSVDMRDSLTRSLSTGTARGLGLSVGQATEAIRWCLYVAGLGAAVTGVLGVYVLQRHQAARIVLSVAAVPVMLTSPFTSSLPGIMVAAGAAALWTRPARDWFAGRPITPSARVERRPTRPVVAPAPPRAVWAPPVGAPVAWGPPPPPRTSADLRPAQIRIACLITWIFALVTAAGGVSVAVAAVLARDELVSRVVHDKQWDQSLDSGLIVPVVVTIGVLIVLWCAANAALAWFVWRRQQWAWILLAISIAGAALFTVLTLPYSLVNLAGLAASLGMLTSRPARGWFRPTGPSDRGAPGPR